MLEDKKDRLYNLTKNAMTRNSKKLDDMIETETEEKNNIETNLKNHGEERQNE